MVAESPRVLVILDQGQTSASVLRSVGAFTGAGLMTVHDSIVAGAAVIDEEMFTHAWYDARAEQLLGLLAAWHREGISAELREVPPGGHADDAEPLELDVLRNIIRAPRRA